MKAAIFAFVLVAFNVSNAYAVSLAVKIACRDDYFAHCSMHAVGSPGLRKCMRDVGPRLSQGCISALVDAGEVKGSKLRKHYAQKPGATTQTADNTVSKKVAATQLSKKRYAANIAKRKRIAKAQGKQYAKPAYKQVAAVHD
jgi:hypothetical protein